MGRLLLLAAACRLAYKVEYSVSGRGIGRPSMAPHGITPVYARSFAPGTLALTLRLRASATMYHHRLRVCDMKDDLKELLRPGSIVSAIVYRHPPALYSCLSSLSTGSAF